MQSILLGLIRLNNAYIYHTFQSFATDPEERVLWQALLFLVNNHALCNFLNV
jgi:hypothetical protein